VRAFQKRDQSAKERECVLKKVRIECLFPSSGKERVFKRRKKFTSPDYGGRGEGSKGGGGWGGGVGAVVSCPGKSILSS